MLLYHGTSAAYLESILKEGLKPRSVTKNSNYQLHPSREDCVYLTDAYAPYFAAVASDKHGKWLLVEVDVSIEDLLPDEDFIEQATRGIKGHLHDLSMLERTKYYRDKLENYAHHAHDSLKGLGTVAIKGGVPAASITRVSEFDPESNNYIVMTALDPSISILNYKFMGSKYRALNRWFFEDDVTPVDIQGEVLSFQSEEQIREQALALAKRSGLKITNGTLRKHRHRSRRALPR